MKMTPQERITRIDILLTTTNRDRLSIGEGQVIVELACGHMTVTKNLHKAHCQRCEEMLRRSVTTGEEDYESFRAGKTRDRMEWDGDKFRGLHEAREPRG